ncbi:MAG: ELWxxDGT repeat protein [Planctomycetota bacterium]
MSPIRHLLPHALAVSILLVVSLVGPVGQASAQGEPTLLHEVNPSATTGSQPRNLVPGATQSFFVADDGTNGAELWVTDGTDAGTMLVLDIRTGIDGSEPRELVMIGDTCYFMATTDGLDFKLWKSDGTSAGTSMVQSDLLAGDAVWFSGLVVVGGDTLLFTADDGISGRELWKSDGTPGNALLVQDSTTFGGGNSFGDQQMIVVSGTMAFVVSNDDTTGTEIHVFDSSDGSYAALDFTAGATGTSFDWLVAADNGRCAFIKASDRLFVTDGTIGNTVEISGSGAAINPADPTFCADKLFFRNGNAIWVATDLSSDASTVQLQSYPSAPTNLAQLGSKLFFVADTGNGAEPQTSDGTVPGTSELADFNPGPTGSSFALVRSLGDVVCFLTLAGGGGGQVAGPGLLGPGEGAGVGGNPNAWGTDGTDIKDIDGSQHAIAEFIGKFHNGLVCGKGKKTPNLTNDEPRILKCPLKPKLTVKRLNGQAVAPGSTQAEGNVSTGNPTTLDLLYLNEGSANLVLNDPPLTVDGESNVTVNSITVVNGDPDSVPEGTSIQVRLEYTIITDGPFSMAVHAMTNDPDLPLHDFTLTGDGLTGVPEIVVRKGRERGSRSRQHLHRVARCVLPLRAGAGRERWRRGPDHQRHHVQ